MFPVPAQHTEQFVLPSTHLDPRKAFKRGPGPGSRPTAIVLQAAGTCSTAGGGRFFARWGVQLEVTGRVAPKRRSRGKRGGRGRKGGMQKKREGRRGRAGCHQRGGKWNAAAASDLQGEPEGQLRKRREPRERS